MSVREELISSSAAAVVAGQLTAASDQPAADLCAGPRALLYAQRDAVHLTGSWHVPVESVVQEAEGGRQPVLFVCVFRKVWSMAYYAPLAAERLALLVVTPHVGDSEYLRVPESRALEILHEWGVRQQTECEAVRRLPRFMQPTTA